MKASLFYLPSIGSRAEIEAGMAGMNPDFYQRMLKELTEQIRLGDELGYDSVSFTEHHFHIEGFELSNNPVLLGLYFASQTKRIRGGQLRLVLPPSKPSLVYEPRARLTLVACRSPQRRTRCASGPRRRPRRPCRRCSRSTRTSSTASIRRCRASPRARASACCAT